MSSPREGVEHEMRGKQKQGSPNARGEGQAAGEAGKVSRVGKKSGFC